MRQALVALLLLAALMAGCADSGSNGGEPAATDPDAFDDVQVTDTTGAIRGVVVDDAITPISGVLVAITGGAAAGQNRTSDDQGAFVFNGLEPGEYFLSASILGYKPVQSRATVVAGDKEPPVTKIQLTRDAANQPYSETLQWTGYLGCGFGTQFAGSVNPCAVDAIACEFTGTCLLNTANVHTFDFGVSDRIPDFAQAELVWDGTQALGDGLNLGWHLSGTSDFKGWSGPSPVIVPANRTEIVDAHGENITSLTVRVFPGSGGPLTVTLQQKFDVYATYFYGYQPREGWTFIVDGPCANYESCL